VCKKQGHCKRISFAYSSKGHNVAAAVDDDDDYGDG